MGEDDRAEAEAPTSSTPTLSSHGSGSVGIPNQSGAAGGTDAPQERPLDPVGERDAFNNAFRTLDYSTLAAVARGRLRAAFEAQVGWEEIRAGDDERNKLRSLVTANFRRPSDDEYRFRLQSDLPRYRDYRLDVVLRRTSGRWYVEEMRPAAP